MRKLAVEVIIELYFEYFHEFQPDAELFFRAEL